MSYSSGELIKTIHTGNTFTVERFHEGGMGIVYIAKRQKDGRLYALKTFREDKVKKEADRDKLTKQFEWESQVWIVLGKHRNIVQAHWFDLSQHYQPFLIMEYVEGGEYGTTLKEWLDKTKGEQSKPLPDIPTALNFAIQALTGLIYARNVIGGELNIPFIHRDIKPDNLFISQDGALKVSDFGLVKAFSILDKPGGTSPYMPPEQWRGEDVEEKTDVYALGCVIYEMIKGASPFELSAEEWQRIIASPIAIRESIKKKHLEEQPKPLEGVSHKLNDIIFRCLEKDSKDRFSFWELREELQSLHEEFKGQRVEVKDEPEPFSADDWNSQGSGFHQLGFPEKAISCYDKAIALNSEDARFYLNRGNAHFRLELRGTKQSEAIDNYKKAIEREPDLIEAYISIASAFSKMEQYQEALEYYGKAEILNPDDAMIYWGRGVVYAMMQKYDEAIEAFERSLELNEQLAESWLGLGNICFCIEEYEEAERCYKKAIGINPRYAEAYRSLARTYDCQGRTDEWEKNQAKLDKLD